MGDVEVTLDDCWSLDLNKRDQWKQVLPGTMSEMIWKGEDDLGSEMTGETGLFICMFSVIDHGWISMWSHVF